MIIMSSLYCVFMKTIYLIVKQEKKHQIDLIKYACNRQIVKNEKKPLTDVEKLK